MRTVLVFAHECAPYHKIESTVGAQRPAQFAKHLPKFGWRAIVLCCHHEERGSAEETSITARVARSLRAADPRESVIIPTPSLPYDGTLDRLWRTLLPKGDRSSLTRDLLRKPLTAAKLHTGDYSQSWQPVAREAAEEVARLTHVDACLGEHSPDAGLWLARWFSLEKGVPWIADFRDQVLQPLPPSMRVIYRPIVRAVLQSASTIVNVTPFWSELDAQLFNRPVATIPNGFDEEEFPTARSERNERFTIVNAGNLWPEMRPETFFEALRLLRSRLGDERFTRTLRFIYRGLAHERMNTLARAAEVSEVVDIGPFVPRIEVLRLLCQADALLLFSMPPSVRDPYLKRGVYPAKVFEYFGAQRPILCVPGDGAQLDELLDRTGTGTVCATSKEISSWLAGRIEQWESHTTTPYSPVHSERASYSRVALAAQLGALLDAAIDGAS